MTLFDNIFICFISIIFPISVWTIYQIYKHNLMKDIKMITFDLALLTSAYCIFKFTNEYQLPMLLSYNVLILLSFIKNRTFTFHIIFIMSIKSLQNGNITVLFIEYIISTIIYMIYTKTKREKYITLYVYLVLTSIYIYGIIELNLNIIFTIFLAITFYFILNYTLNLLQKVEDIVFYSNAVTSLEEEKHLRTALFKITHEIKNPIAVCKGYLDMFDVENKEHSRKYIPIIKNEITKLLTLLQDFLAINKVRLDIETMDIYYLIENIERSITPLLKEKNIELICDTPDDELYIEGDYNRLNQVFINIIKNAVESMEEKENKKLEIKTKVIDEKIKIEVTDTGMGMSVQDMEKLKEPFFTTKRNGTGLGVYLSREILKEHGGKLVYSSKEKIGTTVTATLPIKKDILFS